ALFRMLDDHDFRARCREASARLAVGLRWSEAVKPLVEFCRAPRRSPDLLDPEMGPAILIPATANPFHRTGWRQDVRIIRLLWSEGSAPLVVRKALGRIRRRVQFP
ncbi:MAG: hypothetical protein QOK06_1308, partial [Acidimicrobiaceae bacterium]